MPRPRKNPNDPKWTDDQPETTDTEAAETPETVSEVSDTPKKTKAAKNEPMSMIAAFVRFQQTVPTIVKDAKAQYGAYVTLDNIIGKAEPVLNELGFALTQNVYTNELGEDLIETSLLHTSGEKITSGTMKLKVDGVGMQKFGSAITYGRRYQLAPLLGLSTETDDDGNVAQAASNENAAESKLSEDKDRQKYIRYVEAASQKLEIDVDPSIYDMTTPELNKFAVALKGQLNDRNA